MKTQFIKKLVSIGYISAILVFPYLSVGQVFSNSTVMRLIGHARYSHDYGKSWESLKIGDMLTSGFVIQTAADSSLFVSLGSEEKLPPTRSAVGGLYNPEIHPANLIRLDENAVLSLENISRSRLPNSSNMVDAVRLRLRAGTILCNVKKMSSESSFEIQVSRGIARMEEGIYRLNESGDLFVFRGNVWLEYTNHISTNRIFAGQLLDGSTGAITNSPPLQGNWFHDIWLPSDFVYEDWSPETKNKKDTRKTIKSR